MAYDFSTFKSYMKLRFGQDPALELVNDATNMYGVWINEAVTWLTTRNRFWEFKLNFYFPELEGFDATMNTSDGVAYVAKPATTYIIREAFDLTSNNPINWVHPKKYIRYSGRADTNAEGPPQKWVRFDGNVYFYPTPDDAYNIQILRRKYATAMAADTSTSGIGAEWDYAILNLGAHIGHTWMGDDQKADKAKEAFLDHIQGVIGIYYQEHKAGHNIMGMNPAAKNYDF